MGQGQIWHCRRSADFVLREWPDASVLFDDATGSFHCLNPAAAGLMAILLKSSARSASSLAQELLGEQPDAHDVDMVENVLKEFLSLNLIEQ